VESTLCSFEGFQLNQIPVAHSIEEASPHGGSIKEAPAVLTREMRDILSASKGERMGIGARCQNTSSLLQE